ncbi:MAG: hypothetical protein AABW45_02805 [Nanoarchaeota archaeon]
MAEVVKNLFKVVFGVILVIVAIWFADQYGWLDATWNLIKGGLVLLVVLIGLVLLLVGFSDLKNAE